MLRVLQIVSNLALTSGGVSSVVMNLYRNVDRDKVQFDFLCWRNIAESYRAEIEKMGGRVYYVPSPLRFKSVISAHKQIDAFFREHGGEYPVAHLHSPSANRFFLKPAAKYGVPVRICHSHNTFYSDSKIKSFFNRFLCQSLWKYANKFWACSKKAGEFMYGRDAVEVGKVEVINNAITCEKFAFNPEVRAEVSAQLGVSDNFVIGSVGRLCPQKNQLFLIESFAAMSQQRSDARLVLVGTGPELESIQELIVKTGMSDKIILAGFRPDVNNVLQAFDCFVLPSLKEGLPVSAIEAQACGLPCLLSDDITHESDCGYIDFIPLDKHKWSKALLNIERNKNRHLGQENVKAAGFDIKIEAKRVQDLYRAFAGEF